MTPAVTIEHVCSRSKLAPDLLKGKEHVYVLIPGRYVGAENVEDYAKPFVEKYPRLVAELEEQLTERERLAAILLAALKEVAIGQ